jgi:hypothetical protein
MSINNGLGLQQYQGRQANLKSVNVNRTDLLQKLKENRDKHVEEYNVALEGYKIEVRKVIDEAVAQVKAGEFDSKSLYLVESMPENHLGDYEQVIAMMEISIDDVINLEAAEVQQYVLDQWHWKHSFSATTAKYASNVSAGAARR